MNIGTALVDIFSSKPAGPFLFVGSGLSRRYLGLEDWKGLLSKFCVTGKPFEYYLSTANGSYPLAAQILARDFNAHWWSSSDYIASVDRFREKAINESSALRIEICEYLKSLDQAIALSTSYADEVRLLSNLNVDGVITTNWDLFLEQVFPDYKVYVGQEELLFSNPQEIGEIYKIHGSCGRPESLVLSDSDYDKFNERNAYLAAKLITLFVEHPVIFMGYSISDSNIQSLLKSISLCIGRDKIDQLRKNLIFIQRPSVGENHSISDTYMTVDGVQIPLVLIKTDNFIEIYEAIDKTKRKIPARVLRFCKEQLYELVQSAEPEKKLCVVGIDEIDNKDDVEFLVGVGVVGAGHAPALAGIGYAAIENQDLIHDLLHEDRAYDARQIVDFAIRSAGRNTKNVPVMKYLRAIGINSRDEYIASGLALDKWVDRDVKDFRTKQYAAPFRRRWRNSNAEEVIAGCTPENAAAYIPFLHPGKIDLEALRCFLIGNEEKMDYERSNYASSYRKLACFYDRLKWGW
ncbi:SIR2 family protein [Xanthomonas sp. AM6]|uniref:SIR2 family protein n=1 Tax=Xanthomonas sp. AM6 TaxID=2982531 RepID=UPI0021DB1DAF|nr:SIR2 family protein [Xanthomonas sp. AM6]UYB51919.1 SIR2 family protein [Xanthomonas sp. AM6]